jgi:hypothetical protein
MIAPEDEAPRPPAGPRFGDAVTFAWGDPEAELYGTARIGVVGGETANVLGFVFAGSELVAPFVAGGEPVPGFDWSRIAAGGLEAETIAPLEAWRVAADGADAAFDLRFTAISPPGEHRSELAGVEGYEQLCRVEGTIRAGGRTREISCLGQRGHEWGSPDWERIAVARTVCAWIDEDAGVIADSTRPAGARAHDQESLSALVFDPEPAEVDDPRLSTVYDGDGRQRRAGLELWVGEEDEYPRRLAGEAVCGTTLDMGELRLDVAFFRWRMEGRAGVGRYDVMRRIDA